MDNQLDDKKIMESTCELSNIQMGMCIQYKLSNDLSENVIQKIMTLTGTVNTDSIEKVIQLLVVKHQALGVKIIEDQEKGFLQYFSKDYDFQYQDISKQEEVDNRQWKEIAEAERAKGFQLVNHSLIRFKLIRVKKNSYRFLWTYHHLVMDDSCLEKLWNDFFVFYEALDNGKQMDIIEKNIIKQCAGVNLGDYYNWYKEQSFQQQITYWSNRLKGYENIAIIPSYTEKRGMNSTKQYDYIIKEQLLKRISSSCDNLDISIETVFELSWAILLQRYNRTEDVVFGRVSFDRGLDKFSDLVGLFVCTTPLRIQVLNEDTIHISLIRLEQQKNEDIQNQICPLNQIITASKASKDIIQSIFLFQDESKLEKCLKQYEKNFTIQMEESYVHTTYPISITATMKKGQLHLGFIYDTKEYLQADIELLAQRMEVVLNQITLNLNQKIINIDVVLEQEKKRIQDQFNNTVVPYKRQQTIVDLLEEQVCLRSDEIALIYQDESLTYRELYHRINCVAVKLREMGVKKGDAVPIIATRSFEMIIGIYGIIKAGAAYVPIDKDYPEERIQYIFKECSPKVSVVYGGYHCINLKEIDLKDDSIWNKEVTEFNSIIEPSDVAYIIYTSGTTGNPKGVMLSHAGVVSMRYYLKRLYQVESSDHVLQFANYVFDASVWEMTIALLNGAKLVLIDPEDITDMERFYAYTFEKNISICLLPPQFYMQTKLKGLKVLTTGGSAATQEVIHRAIKENNRYINAYGPTENTVLATHWEMKKGDSIPSVIPIGKPIDNSQIYILNGNTLCGFGLPGEICIAGDGIAKGYLNQEQLTKEAFVANPFQEGFMYRSGDLGAWLEDGTIVCLGRIDEQVKIRGYRIELLEIESTLRNINEITDATVIAREDEFGDKTLCAYVVSKDAVDWEWLRNQLSKQLPNYMVPTHFMQISAIPINQSGKVNKHQLPIIEMTYEGSYMAPKSKAEQIVCQVFEEVLAVRQVGRKDSFFVLGGDSIKAIRIVSKIRNQGYETSVKKIMNLLMVEKIASDMTEIVEKSHYEQGEVSGIVEETPIIRVFRNWNLKKQNHFNQDIMMEIGLQSKDEVEQIIKALMVHHDMLRAVYQEKWVTVLKSKQCKPLELEEFHWEHQRELDSIAVFNECTKIQQSIDLEKGPLIKGGIFYTKETNYLFLCIHHLIIDGVSYRILIDDYDTATRQLKEGKTIHFSEKTVSFIEWSKALKEYGQSAQLKQEIAYWDKIDMELEQVHKEYPSVRTCENNQFKTIEVSVDQEKTEQFIHKISSVYHTEINDLLLSALAMSMKKVFERDKFSVTLEGHGREEIHKTIHIDRTVGWFTTMYPIILVCEDDIQRTIIETKEMLHKIPKHGIGYGVLGRDCNHFCDVSFNYLGELDYECNGRRISFLKNGIRNAKENGYYSNLSFTGLMSNKQLVFTVQYNESYYNLNVIKKLGNEFCSSLKQIINHCMEQKGSITTPSDYEIYDLTYDNFKQIQCKYGDFDVIYSLAPLQQGILFQHMFSEKRSEYFIQNLFDVTGTINEIWIKEALYLLTVKYPVLKTAFVYDELQNPKQIIVSDREIEYERMELTSKDIIQVKEITTKDLSRGFDLEQDSLLRVKLIYMNKECKHMLWSFHHIILDGWCLSYLFGDFILFYDQLSSQRYVTVIADEILQEQLQKATYADYIQWINKQDKEAALDYWRDILDGYDNCARIEPHVELEEMEYQVDTKRVMVSPKVTKDLIQFSNKCESTLNTIIEVAWGLLLQKHTRTEDVVFGKVVSGRNIKMEGIEDIVGLFANTVPVRIKSQICDSIVDLLKQTQKQGLNSEEYNYITLAEIQSAIGRTESLIHNLYVFENHMEEASYLNGKQLSLNLISSREQTNYEINLISGIKFGQIYLELMYDSSRYSREEIELTLEHLQNILVEISKNGDLKLKNLQIITSEERNKVVHQFNDTVLEYDKSQTMIDLFEEQVSNHPNSIAFVYQNKSFTYQFLNEKANIIAHELRSRGIQRNDMVPIMANRGFGMIQGILGIIKSGAAYVPIDPEYPRERITYIISDCKAKFVVAYQENLDWLTDVELIRLDEPLRINQSVENPIRVNQSSDLAYVIYTSGTTGKPKGVLIKHLGVVAMKHYLKQLYRVDSSDRILQFANYVFDASVWEITMALLNGAKLIQISKEDILDINKFNSYTKEQQITITLLPPQYYIQTKIKGLKVLTTGGSAASQEIVTRALKENQRYINAYGPTENTVLATHWEKNGTDNPLHNIPIGKPICNSQIYILNEDILCGIGLPGELCIAGDAVAKGYLNQEQLTKDKFVSNPFGSGTMYRTGDLAKWNLDGEIVYLGRIDEQVKIRGYRVELLEIESLIRKINLVKDVCVVAKTNQSNEQVICAYIVSDTELNMEFIKSALNEQLPHYMIPSHMLQIRGIPINQSGKVAYKQLPEISIENQRRYEKPRNEREKILCKIFEKILNCSQVGIWDSFFTLGGHSLNATQVVNLIADSFGQRVMVRDIFLYDSVAKLSELLQARKKEVNHPIPKATKKDYYVMSPMERQIYVASCMDESHILYNIPQVYKIKKTINHQQLQEALQQMIDHNEILRTAFIVEENQYLQKVLKDVRVDFDCVQIDGRLQPNEFHRFINEFQLQQPPLFRVRVIVDHQSTYLLIDIHHIICDGITMDIFIKQLSEAYENIQLQTSKIQYKDFSEWFEKKDLSSQSKYWNQALQGISPSLPILAETKYKKKTYFTCNVTMLTIPNELKKKIRSIVKETGYTNYMIYVSALILLLNQYSLDDSFVIGTPVNGRIHHDIEDVMGVFINVLPLYIKIDRSKTYLEYLSEVKEMCVGAFSNQDYPYEAMIEDLVTQGVNVREGVFHVLFSYQYEKNDSFSLGDAVCNNLKVTEAISKYELQFVMTERESMDVLEILYDKEWYASETIETLMNRFITVLEQVLHQVSIPLDHMQYLSRDEMVMVLEQFNQNNKEYHPQTVVDMYELQVITKKNHVAIISDDRSVTYGELDSRVNQLVEALNHYHVNQDDFVAIIAKRSIDMITAIIAVLKAKAAYVPIDPSYPPDRIDYILKDCKPKVVLVTEGIQITTECAVLSIESAISKEIIPSIVTNNIIDGNSLAYCIYTSGTTGKPKGVMIEHQSLYNAVCCFYDEFIHSESIITPLFTNYAFDLTVPSIYLPLCYGGTLDLIAEDREVDFDYILSRMEYTFFKMTPSHLKLLLGGKRTYINGPCTVVVGGEFLRCETANEFKKHYSSDVWLINEYGPTEATVGATIYQYNYMENGTYVSIGKPLNNTQIYIISHGQLCGVDMVGEICIAGVQVARGYLNCEEIEKEKFIDNPFKTGKLYRTGDLARWTHDGNIVCLGRIDDQIKVNGHRIEIGEIESVIGGIAAITDVVVLIHESQGEGRLLAYYVANIELSQEYIRNILEEKLPIYMIPVGFKQIDQIPLTANGKVNKRLLPDIVVTSNTDYVPPTTDIDFALCKVFQQVLGVEQVGMTDGFFELGGDSIKAIQIAARIRELGYQLSVKDIMNHHRVERIRYYVTESNELWKGDNQTAGVVIPTPIMREFFQRQLPKPEHYNQDVLLFVNKIGAAVVKQSIEAIIIHHDILRSVCLEDTIEIMEGDPSEFYEFYEYNFSKLDLKDKKIDQICETLQQGFDLKNGPLVKVALFHLQQGNYTFICIHHIIVDSVSFRIVIEDFYHGLDCYEQGKVISLPPKTASFIEWSEALKDYETDELLQQEKKYWSQELYKVETSKIPIATTNLYGINEIIYQLDHETTNQLLYQTASGYGVRIVDVLLTAFSTAVGQIFDLSSVAIWMEGHGREEIHKNIPIHRTVGWFTNRYPMVVSSTNSLLDCLIDTKDKMRRVPNHGIGFGLLCSDEMKCMPNISFNYLGEMDNGNEKICGFCSRGVSVARENGILGLIDINAYVADNQLNVILYYDQAHVEKETVDSLLGRMKVNLSQLLQICLNQKERIQTASDFTDSLLTRDELKRITNIVSLERIKDIYPLTPLQEGILYYTMANPDTTEYVVQHVFSMDGLVDYDHIKIAAQQVVNRHDSLRTIFVTEQLNQPRQIVLNNIDVDYETIQCLQNEDYEFQCRDVMNQDVIRPFHLHIAPPLRIKLIGCNQHHFKMVWTYHHIIMDGWCSSILFSTFLRYKNLLDQGLSKEELEQVILRERSNSSEYAEYVNLLRSKPVEPAMSYWNNLLDGYDEVAEFKPLQGKTHHTNSNERFQRLMSKELTKDLFEFTKQNSITVNSCTEAMTALVLSEYAHVKDVVFGKVVSGRNEQLRGVEKIIGLFINTIVVRVNLDTEETMTSLLQRIQRQGIESEIYSYCSLAQIQKKTKQKGDLVKVLYVFENYYESLEENQKDFIFEGGREQTNYSISISISVIQNQLAIDILFDEKEYQGFEIELMLAKMEKALEFIVYHHDQSIQSLQITTKQEMNQILTEFNQTEFIYDKDKTMITLFEDEVLHKPDQVALMYQSQSLTYKEFNEKVNCVAHELYKRGVKPGDIVPILAKRSMEMVIGIYGILKAGGAYVPIDLEYPLDRICYIIKDCKASVVITYGYTIGISIENISLEDTTIWQNETTNLKRVNKSSDLAYVIYTSGTTGRPKGVMLRHSGVVAMRYYLKDLYQVDCEDRVLQFANYVFDASVWEMTIALLNGATLVLIDKENIIDVTRFNDYTKEKGITLTLLPPQYYLQTKINGLKVLTTGGSPASKELVKRAVSENQRYINAYGPTENTVLATHWEVKQNVEIPDSIPIGRPIYNSKIYIMKQDKLCGIGIPGELCIAGDALAVGYLNQQELTHNKFVRNPFEQGFMYRTGDLAKWTVDGEIEYLGRIDQQVKIRGFRIELLEVESALLQLPIIEDAAVVARAVDGSEQVLCGYVVSSQAVRMDEIKLQLRELLPNYMIPTLLLQMDTIPVNQSGKVDQKALPDITFEQDESFIPPCNKIEETVCHVFEEVLSVNQVGRKDSFFTLGGDSIKAIQVVSKLRALGYEISVRDLMGRYSVDQISLCLVSVTSKEDYEQGEVIGTIRKTPIVKMFESWRFPKKNHFNQDVLIHVKEQSADEIHKIIKALFLHHDMLRAIYHDNELEIVKVEDCESVELIEIDCKQDIENVEQRINLECTYIQESMDLSHGPLMKAALFYTATGDYLFLCIHHLVVDGISWRILLEDYQEASKQLKLGQPIQLPDKTASFQEWADALNEYATGSEVKAESEYWIGIQEQLNKFSQDQIYSREQQRDLALRLFHPNTILIATKSIDIGQQYGQITYTMDSNQTKQLLSEAIETYHMETLELLLCGFSMAYGDLTNLNQVCVGLEGHGREEIHKRIAIDRTVGWFTTIYPIVLSSWKTVQENLIETKENLHKIPNHGLGYGLLYKEGDRLPVISFNYLGQMDSSDNQSDVKFFQSGQSSDVENRTNSTLLISVMEVLGQFTFTFTFLKDRWDEIFVLLLIQKYMDSLSDCIEHCINQTESVTTISDLDADDLSEDELAFITTMLD